MRARLILVLSILCSLILVLIPTQNQVGTQASAYAVELPPQDINYEWKTDPLSQFMAWTPGPVLHRVNGSWFNAPDIPQEARTYAREEKSLFGPSTPIFIGDTNFCTLTIAGIDSNNNAIGITASHCGNIGDTVVSADTWRTGVTGIVTEKNPSLDYLIITFGKGAIVSNSYNGTTITSMGGKPEDGTILCKTGVATGYTCGNSISTSGALNWAHVCSMQGDSGSPLTQDNRLVGLIRGAAINNFPCTTPLQGILFSPVMSVRMDQILVDMARKNIHLKLVEHHEVK